MDNSPRFSEIWMCNIYNQDGSIQSGYRAAFILSNDKNNTHSTTLILFLLHPKQLRKDYQYTYICRNINYTV